MKISDVLTPSLTVCQLPGSSKKRVLENISQLFAEQLGGGQEQCDALLNNFLNRERLGSTDMGARVAIPHCRTIGVKKIIQTKFEIIKKMVIIKKVKFIIV